jgi:hypothetical protein
MWLLGSEVRRGGRKGIRGRGWPSPRCRSRVAPGMGVGATRMPRGCNPVATAPKCCNRVAAGALARCCSRGVLRRQLVTSLTARARKNGPKYVTKVALYGARGTERFSGAAPSPRRPAIYGPGIQMDTLLPARVFPSDGREDAV